MSSENSPTIDNDSATNTLPVPPALSSSTEAEEKKQKETEKKENSRQSDLTAESSEETERPPAETGGEPKSSSSAHTPEIFSFSSTKTRKKNIPSVPTRPPAKAKQGKKTRRSLPFPHRDTPPKTLAHAKPPSTLTATTRFTFLLAIAVVFVFSLGFVLDRVAVSSKVDRNIYVNGENLGGLTRAELKDHLTAQASSLLRTPVTVQTKDFSLTISPLTLGAETNIDATVSATFAANKGWNPLAWAQHLFTKTDIPLPQVQLPLEQTNQILHPMLRKIEQAPQNAHYDFAPDSATLIPHVDGQIVDMAALADDLTRAIRNPNNREVNAPLISQLPETTTDDLIALGISQPVGSFTTKFVPGQSRVTNITRIAEIVDGTILKPGERFSVNEFVGPRTIEKGFVSAGVIYNGKYTDDIGGGVSQFGTTLFNAAYFSGLPLTKHKPHSYYISRYPEGREATLHHPEVDLIFKNNYASHLKIKAWVEKNSITVTLFATDDGRKVTSVTGQRYASKAPETIREINRKLRPGSQRVTSQGSTGFSVKVTRTITYADAEKTVDTRVFRTVYKAEPRRIEYNPLPTSTTTTTLFPFPRTTMP